MGIRPEDIARAVAGGNKVLQQLRQVCPKTEEVPLTIPKKRIRQSTKPLLNKLETEFQKHYEDISGFNLIPQAISFRLGNGISYRPDFILINNQLHRVVAFEVKGPHAFRGGLENLKVAASLYPQITWELWWKEAGKWESQVVLP